MEDLGRCDEAKAYYTKSARFADDAGFPALKIRAQINGARLVSDIPTREAAYRDAAENARKLGEKELEADATHALGDMLSVRGDYAAAAERLMRAAAIYRTWATATGVPLTGHPWLSLFIPFRLPRAYSAQHRVVDTAQPGRSAYETAWSRCIVHPHCPDPWLSSREPGAGVAAERAGIRSASPRGRRVERETARGSRGSPCPAAHEVCEKRGQGRFTCGFDVDDYDRSQELVVDPTLDYSFYSRGPGADPPAQPPS